MFPDTAVAVILEAVQLIVVLSPVAALNFTFVGVESDGLVKVFVVVEPFVVKPLYVAYTLNCSAVP